MDLKEQPQGITLTEPAAEKARALRMANPDYQGKVLRLYLEGKGCDGFYYGVSFDDKTAEDHSFVSHDEVIIVDADTIEFVEGSEIEWVDDERGQGFLVNNPRHRKFRGKFYKRKTWQTRLQEKRDSIAKEDDI